ncbi:DAO-domain-containing protein [Exidia glandulosa HHB12029]|uniref:Glycerol-3-phosphate dehydrogenase n=1 Tax=Exidia glandulosa HHB12029 TaxID=1314781 RepID=A0A165QB70_EXIGL|nr:DAO-domain-containing protein [Exidia glandulosa HHB12029]
MFRSFSRRRPLWLASAAAATGAAYYYHASAPPKLPTEPRAQARRPPPPWTPPSRAEMLQQLKASSRPGVSDSEEFDLLIVGGGATGAGVAVDASSRGLRVALVERDDFGSGTSSKSTKLVHGGVRYLQKAVMELDYEQYKLVREALHERRIFLQTAPYLSNMLPIMLPVYKYWQVPYYWAGCKMYDFLAGGENMESSYLMSRGKALEAFPMLQSKGLVGAVVYYDGQHNDARMNIALIMTAVKHGAVVANYCEVTKLLKTDADGKLCGASVQDTLTGEKWNIRAKGIINATGPFTDDMLTLDNKQHKPIVAPSSGIHITLPNYYSPRKMGLLDPATSDGRVIFFLPWEGNTIAGTTDTAISLPVEREPKAREDEVRWVLEEVRHYLSPDIRVRRGDVLSAWSGVRPLVRAMSDDGSGKGTQGLVRSHMLHVSPSGLLTIAGGKWTTYRAMAAETVDLAVKTFNLEGKAKTGCITDKLRLVGSEGWSPNMFIGLIQRYGTETEVAQHLARNYGDRAWTVLDGAEPTGLRWPLHGNRLSNLYPYIEAEVRYAVRNEYAQTAVDFLARRSRLAFLNAQAALDALPRVIDIMGDELKWSRSRRKAEVERTKAFLESMGLAKEVSAQRRELMGWGDWARGLLFGQAAPVRGTYSRAQFAPGEVDRLRAAFAAHAVGDRLTKPAIREAMKQEEEYQSYSAADVQSVLEQTGLDTRTDIGLDEFLEVCAALKEVSLGPAPPKKQKQAMQSRIPVEKSGGGV